MNKYLIKDIDADCYTHDDGPVELTFTVTEVPDMMPEEF